MIIPSVSVVIPNFNNGHTIKKTLESVYRQTIAVKEVFVIDNYSTDNSHMVVSSIKSLHSNLEIVSFKNKGIIANSRNFGASIASSDYVAFLDADDIFAPNHIELSLEKIISTGAHVIYSNFYHVYSLNGKNKSRPYYCFTLNSSQALKDLLLRGNPICTSSVVIAKTIFNMHSFPDSSFYFAWEDYAFWLQLAEDGVSFAHQKIPSVYYNYTFDNISKKYSVVSIVNNNIYKHLKNDYKKNIMLFRVKPAWLAYKSFITDYGHVSFIDTVLNFILSIVSSVLYLKPIYFLKTIAYPMR